MFALLNPVPKNVMIIDDDPFSVLLCRMKLKKVTEDQYISEFYDIDSALAHLKEQQTKKTAVIPDLILLEVLMNNSSGWDFIEQYKQLLLNGEINQSQLVLLTSSQFFSDYRKASGMKSVNGFIMKPLQISTLLDIYRNVYDGKASTDNYLLNSFVV
jgi:response regulator RpfG family c-di-GMP phosphodiesterase